MARLRRPVGCTLVAALVAFAGCAPQLPRAPSPARGGIFHVVRPGETLYRIGKVYDVPFEELARINRIRDPGHIRVGQRLFIPGAARQLPVEVITPAEPASAPPVDAEPLSARDRFLWPVNGTIHSHYGPRGASFHDGIDIAAPEGTPIRVIADGVVIYSDQLRGYGNIVIVRHEREVVSVYAHNQVNLAREGQRVSRGEVIARVGSTGRVSGPHLHFEIRRNNFAQDPLVYLPQPCCAAATDGSSPES
ncbi:MAG TPA: LysM peptidoglycan-binding domain-containing M23 family metallopeptidase [candidate division Zixibacteria bacterium]|nr:LysM peptidoglycan-binding domain-containing M23 family metallopeptidase [candidate division Zixibacteria bacterium]